MAESRDRAMDRQPESPVSAVLARRSFRWYTSDSGSVRIMSATTSESLFLEGSHFRASSSACQPWLSSWSDRQRRELKRRRDSITLGHSNLAGLLELDLRLE